MSKVKDRIGKSDAQANAEALARRESSYAEASAVSFTMSWDWYRRAPTDLRSAVAQVRGAYRAEVPIRLHEGFEQLAPDGTPRMTARAEGYIFGNPQGDDAGRDPETGQRDLTGYYFTPFRATLDRLARGNDTDAAVSRIVSRITIGGQGAKEAVIAEGVPVWAASLVAYPALRHFLMSLSDIKLHPPGPDGLLPGSITSI